MSILIKDKALPKKCEECLFYGIDAESGCFLEKCYVIRRAGQDKPSWCPLVPVPPHGRLIDVDYADEYAYDELEVANYYLTGWEAARAMQKIYQNAPTVIEAEEEQE